MASLPRLLQVVFFLVVTISTSTEAASSQELFTAVRKNSQDDLAKALGRYTRKIIFQTKRTFDCLYLFPADGAPIDERGPGGASCYKPAFSDGPSVSNGQICKEIIIMNRSVPNANFRVSASHLPPSYSARQHSHPGENVLRMLQTRSFIWNSYAISDSHFRTNTVDARHSKRENGCRKIFVGPWC